MYVCVCNAVTERHIDKAVDEGASTLRELRQRLGVAGECGRCATCARDCLRNALADRTQPNGSAGAGLFSMPSLAAEAL